MKPKSGGLRASGKTRAHGDITLVKPEDVTNPQGSTDHSKIPKGARVEERTFQHDESQPHVKQFLVIVPDKDGIDRVAMIAHSTKELKEAHKALAEYLK